MNMIEVKKRENNNNKQQICFNLFFVFSNSCRSEQQQLQKYILFKKYGWSTSVSTSEKHE